MNSSISSFDTLRDPPPLSRNAHDLRCLTSFGITTLVCFALAAASYHLPQLKPFRPPAGKATFPADSKNYYVGYAHGGADEYDIYFNISRAASELKRADVLFLGGSRMKYGLKDATQLHQFFDKRHLRFFNLGFGYGEPSFFPLEIIRKYDLHPKFVIVNADPFFIDHPSGFANTVLNSTRFNAMKFNFETAAAFRFEHLLHSVVPYVDIMQWTRQADVVEFRSKLDGTIVPGGMQGNPSPAVIDYIKQVPRADTATLHVAKEFEDEMTARGTKMILTWIPVGPYVTRPLVRLAGVPLIVPRVRGLQTVDGSHLDIPSARRFCSAFLTELAPILDRATKMPVH